MNIAGIGCTTLSTNEPRYFPLFFENAMVIEKIFTFLGLYIIISIFEFPNRLISKSLEESNLFTLTYLIPIQSDRILYGIFSSAGEHQTGN